MFPILGIVAVAVGIAVLEFPSLWRNRRIKEQWVFALLLLCGTGLGIAKALNAPLPNPLAGLEVLLRPFHDAIMYFLK